jgi:hypothetical protein
MKQIILSVFAISSGFFAPVIFAADMSVSSIIHDVQTRDKSCSMESSRTSIDHVKIGTAAERNQIQADNEWKRDGIKGKPYLILSTKYQGKLVGAASYGPLSPTVIATEFNTLLKSKICFDY